MYSTFKELGLKAPDTGPGSIGERFGETFDEKNLALMTESGRFFYINKGFEVFKDYPVAGQDSVHSAGLRHCLMDRQFTSHYGIRSDIYGGKYFYSDNQYIQVIAETGVSRCCLICSVSSRYACDVLERTENGVR